jgi:hypothetical protein
MGVGWFRMALMKMGAIGGDGGMYATLTDGIRGVEMALSGICFTGWLQVRGYSIRGVDDQKLGEMAAGSNL